MNAKWYRVAMYLMVILGLLCITYSNWIGEAQLRAELLLSEGLLNMIVTSFANGFLSGISKFLFCITLLVQPLVEACIGYYLCKIVGIISGTGSTKTVSRIAGVLFAAIFGLYLVMLFMASIGIDGYTGNVLRMLYGPVLTKPIFLSPVFVFSGICARVHVSYMLATVKSLD